MVIASEVAETKTLTLTSSDGKDFIVSESGGCLSEIIKNMVEDDCVTTAIPIPNVDSKTLAKVIVFLNKHGDKTVSSEDMKKFNEEYVTGVEIGILFDLATAADYLDIKEMMEVVTQKIADIMENKSVKWVRKTFGIENDLDPEEEQALMDEYPWAWEGLDPDSD